jgi:glycosyltransferase involved in cell wall biosynthesis
MNNKFRYIDPAERKKILLLSDDLRMHSGIATMSREIVIGTAHHFNWVNLGAGIKHPEVGKIIDVSDSINKAIGIDNANVKVIPNEGYGNPDTLRFLIQNEKPDAIMIFTDPRYWIWLFEIEREIRSKVPIIYYNIWDDFPAPMYNKPYYESVDALLAISKQTKLINELVLGDLSDEKVISYVPHGINEEQFYPIRKNHPESKKVQEFRKSILEGREDIDFVVLFNSRNVRRKSPGDTILAYRMFCDRIGKDLASKCALVMHTEEVSEHGTDLWNVREVLCDPTYVNVFFSTRKLETSGMNMLYNMADVTMLPSSNEGWGLSLTESLMTGTMVIANVTGGMQDQLRFVDEKGNWYTPSADVPSNHLGTYKKYGQWGVAVYPSNRSMVGSPLTPYIFDDRCNPEDLATAIKLVWEMSPEDRKTRGLAGREWVTSDESGMSARRMCENIITEVDKTLNTFRKRSKYELIKVGKLPQQFIPHKLTGY